MIALLQARTNSKRLTKKILRKINNVPMFLVIINSLKRSKYIKKIILTTSIYKSDDILISICKKKKINYFRGDLEDVSKRIRDLLLKLRIKKNYFVRISADSPLIDFNLIDKFIKITLKKNQIFSPILLRDLFPKANQLRLLNPLYF